MKLFYLLKKYIRNQRSRRYTSILNNFHHGYAEFGFSDHIYKILKQRIQEDLYRISSQKSNKSLSKYEEDFSKKLSFVNRIMFKIFISKIKWIYELREIISAYKLTSVEIVSTLAKKNQIDDTLLRFKQCRSNAEELHLIIPIDIRNSKITTASFDIISYQFCDVNCVLMDKKSEYSSKSLTVDFPDADFVSNAVLANYVPVQYRFSLLLNRQGGVIFDPCRTYHGFCNLLLGGEFFYIKIQFKKKSSHGNGLKIAKNNSALKRAKIFLGDIKSTD